MFDHVTIRVADRDASEAFFSTVLIPLGIEKTYRTNAFSIWHDFMLTEAEPDHPVTRGAHIAFAAPTREQVDEFWQAGGARGEAPREDGDAYRARLAHPDGTTVEAVHRDGPRGGEGKVEHVTIRVADLDAALAFYRTIAPATGFDLCGEATFARGAPGGSFSLLPGTPTENLHVAFPGDDDAVRRFYDAATAAGYRGNGEPGERARYHPGYYAAYVLDPDGNNIEVVDHHRG